MTRQINQRIIYVALTSPVSKFLDIIARRAGCQIKVPCHKLICSVSLSPRLLFNLTQSWCPASYKLSSATKISRNRSHIMSEFNWNVYYLSLKIIQLVPVPTIFSKIISLSRNEIRKSNCQATVYCRQMHA